MRVLIGWIYTNTTSVLLAQLIVVSTGSLVVFSPPRATAAQETGWYMAYGATLWVLAMVVAARSGGALGQSSPFVVNEPSRVSFEPRKPRPFAKNAKRTGHPRGLFLRLCARVKHDIQWRDLFGFHVAVDQEALAVFGYVVAENVGRRDWRAATDLE